MSSAAATDVGTDEIAVLRGLGLAGAMEGEVKVSCAELASDFSTSTQTASRRLQALESAGLIDRDTVSDGQWITITEVGIQALRTRYEEYRTLFEDHSTVDLTGTVTTGMGEGRHYISLPGYLDQFVDRLGYEPFPGTLNIALTAESTRRRGALEAFSAIPIDRWEDENRTYGGASCYPATVEPDGGERYADAHVIVPNRSHHDEDQLELIAPDKLRDVLDIEDGSTITIHIEEPE